jgi:predicted metal-dependent phosphotriesterase family hydrolase
MEDKNYDLKIILWLILFLLFGIIIIACNKASHDYVMTVNGPESIGKSGITLEHEHILVDFIGADSTGYIRWNRDTVIKCMLPFLSEAKEKGIRTSSIAHLPFRDGIHRPLSGFTPGGGAINGYTDIIEYIIPQLIRIDFTDDEVDLLTVKNPAEVYKIRNIKNYDNYSKL